MVSSGPLGVDAVPFIVSPTLHEARIDGMATAAPPTAAALRKSRRLPNVIPEEGGEAVEGEFIRSPGVKSSSAVQRIPRSLCVCRLNRQRGWLIQYLTASLTFISR